ncbi:hypothetical protein KXW98_002481 [Aspergillus fumigatus]|uniref:Uncharacterized protein n=3 Tax=Aspergillus fumigatus TaxID=746128 RepID=A4D9Z2_ASPFU|nr:conserved hypothetical protein [Aspergillus fumigatus Af293]EDP53477.1 conserved hypothetical protein [Aspergillus fumigatus A1163]KAF4275173.1 hypothetical protein CNMCM8812_002673 [Aspergillus fumigatus]KMK58676.1 hypothetical protein Y699_07903 [Aspergillus fumigatus Z5]EBA27273.1 conserved hypothetical protein [Aspergillus fumigatus Af293]KAF4277765.1 hypothetical protein CNMCM8057_002289 [Aspergillus fumigatus]
MAPALRHLFSRREFDPGSTSTAFADEWSNPSNYAFTILLLIGGDLIHRALAQLAGGWVTPVAFSFGWVSYAASSICSALGEYRMMPDADTACCLINGKNGYVRGNNSWVLGRIMRDYEYWMGEPVREKTESLIQARWDFDRQRQEREVPGSGSRVPRPSQAGLVVSLWQPSTTKPSGEPGHDLLHWSGIIVTVIQLGIAAVPLGLSGDWGILMITAAATILCYVTGALGQWKVEKWACRRLDTREKKNFVLTRGNGAQHAIAIISNGRGLDLEDLATGFSKIDSPSITLFAQLATIVFGIMWIALLITASALQDDSWYLIAVGGLGMLQNIFVAGWKRTPDAYGVPLEFIGVVGEVKVMKTLMEVERRYEKLGKSMIGTFFPGDLRENEVREWEAIAQEWKEKRSMNHQV